MSLGAIDFGLIVDSSVIMIENCSCACRTIMRVGPHSDVIRDAAIEVRKPTMFGELIIFDRLFADSDAAGDGRQAVPTDGSDCAVCSVRFADFVDDLHAGDGLAGTAEEDAGSRRISGPLDQVLLSPRGDSHDPAPVDHHSDFGGVFAVSIPTALHLGAEFMPRLEEGDLLIEAVRLPSATLEGAITDVSAD
jgi:cobalt-zinc-cadmium resistance protein CzcA